MTTLQAYVIAEFHDGIQIIPKSWINDDVTKVRWPLFSSQKRFDKAVKEMEKWQESWPEFPLKGIIGSTSSYEKARQKLRDAEIFSDIPSGSDRDEILKRSRKTRAKYVRSTNEETESEDERIIKTPQFPKFPEKNLTKNIKTNEIKKGNEVASLKLCKENILMRTSSAKLSSKIQKGGEVVENENGRKLVEVVKKVVKNVPSTLKSDSEMSGFLEIFSEDEGLVNSLNHTESSAIGKEKENNYQRFIVRKLISLHLQVKALREGQEKILQKFESFSEQQTRQFQSSEEIETIDIWCNLPLKDERSLQELEIKLKEDENYRKKMIKEFANLGGQNVKTSALKLMRKIFTNELAVQYSWVGGKKKNIFVDLMICKVILSALRKHYQNSTEEELSAPIKIWLAHAKERCSKATLNTQN